MYMEKMFNLPFFPFFTALLRAGLWSYTLPNETFIHFSLWLLLRFTNKIYTLLMSIIFTVKLLTFRSSFVWAFPNASVCMILPLSVRPSSLHRNSIALIVNTHSLGCAHSFLSRLWSQPHKVHHHTHLLDLSISHRLHQLSPAQSNINH